jgi:hypothetical protein
VYARRVPSYEVKVLTPSAARSRQVGRPDGVGADLTGELLEHLVRRGAVDGERHERLAAPRRAADLRAGDVDAGVAQAGADHADDAGPVVVAEEQQVLLGDQLDVEAVDLDELLDLRGPVRVPDTDTSSPVGRTPCTRTTLR